MPAVPRRALDRRVLVRATALLRVLTHPDRLRICERLLEGACPVGALAAELGLRQTVVSQHLNQLRAYEIVAPQRVGRAVHYRVVHPGPAWLLECIRRSHSEPGAGGNPRNPWSLEGT
jgi:DNA-binding transcriptional ArsR family regulator